MDLLFLCIGNPEGGDDSVGPFIANLLKKEKINVIDGQTYPENFTGKIKNLNPENLIIIDAIDMNLEPGEIRIVPKEKIGLMTISTHGIPISLLINYLQNDIKNIKLIGIQPKKMTGKISENVKKSALKLIDLIIKKDFEKLEKI